MMNFVKSLSKESLARISPASLSAFACSAGWEKGDEYRHVAYVYSGDRMPDILVPKIRDIGDYTMAVSDLITTFAVQSGREESAVYYDLAVADRDVIRVSGGEVEGGDLPAVSGLALMNGSMNMVQAVACSLDSSQPVYRAGSNQMANSYLKQLDLAYGDLVGGGLVLVSPVVPPVQSPLFPDTEDVELPVPLARRITGRLHQSLIATREAADQVVIGYTDAFVSRVGVGVSANLCEAITEVLDDMAAFQVAVSFALTRPVEVSHVKIGFDKSYSEILRSAASYFRAGAPIYDANLFGFIHRLSREDPDVPGAVGLKASVHGKVRSVSAVLNSADYDRAIEAHRTNSAVSVAGDLEQVGQRWHLRDARLVDTVDPADDC